MSYRIVNDELIEPAVQRIAREQVQKAIDEIEDPRLEAHERVHQVRKRCKKLRALLRLVRPALGDDYRAENAWYRDTARGLSAARDARANVDTFDRLIERYAGELDGAAFGPMRSNLLEQTPLTDEPERIDARLGEARERLESGCDRIGAWRIDGDGFDAIAGGLARTYGRGRVAMRAAYATPSTDSFHEWRKRAKYHRYHLRLLQDSWPGPLKAQRTAARELADRLGADHDLAVLRDALLAAPGEFGDDSAIQVLTGVIDRRQMELRLACQPLGARLFAEKPKRFTSRMRSYYDAAQQSVALDAKFTHAPALVAD